MEKLTDVSENLDIRTAGDISIRSYENSTALGALRHATSHLMQLRQFNYRNNSDKKLG